jgi:hypothetical protein
VNVRRWCSRSFWCLWRGGRGSSGRGESGDMLVFVDCFQSSEGRPAGGAQAVVAFGLRSRLSFAAVLNQRGSHRGAPDNGEERERARGGGGAPGFL